MDSPGAVGRRRGNSRINAEDQALDQIAKEAGANPLPSLLSSVEKQKKKILRTPPSPRVNLGVQHEPPTVLANRSGTWAVEPTIEQSPAIVPCYLQHGKCVLLGRTGWWIVEEDEEQEQEAKEHEIDVKQEDKESDMKQEEIELEQENNKNQKDEEDEELKLQEDEEQEVIVLENDKKQEEEGQDDVEAMITTILEYEKRRFGLGYQEGGSKTKKRKKKAKGKKQNSSDRKSQGVAAEEAEKVTELQDDERPGREQPVDQGKREGFLSHDEVLAMNSNIQIVLYPPKEEFPADDQITADILKSDDSGAVFERDSPPKPIRQHEPIRVQMFRHFNKPWEKMTRADLEEMINLSVTSITADMRREVDVGQLETEILREKVRVLHEKISTIQEVVQKTTQEVTVQFPTPIHEKISTKQGVVEKTTQEANVQFPTPIHPEPAATTTSEQLQQVPATPAPAISDRSFRLPEETPLNPARIAALKRRLTLEL